MGEFKEAWESIQAEDATAEQQESEQVGLRVAHDNAAQHNPDAAAAAVQESKAQGLPFEAVAAQKKREPSYADVWAEIQDSDSALRERLLEDPGFAAVAQDDVTQLAAIEKLVRGEKAFSLLNPALKKATKAMGAEDDAEAFKAIEAGNLWGKSKIQGAAAFAEIGFNQGKKQAARIAQSTEYEFQRQRIGLQIGDIGWANLNNEATPEQLKLVDELEAKQAAIPQMEMGFIEGIPAAGAGMLPLMWKAASENSTLIGYGATEGAMIGMSAGAAGAAAVTAPVGGAGAPVGALGGAIAGAGSGASVAMTAAMTVTAAKQEGGQMFQEAIRIPGVDRNSARLAAYIVCGVNGGLEGLAFDKVMKLPGIRNIVGKKVTRDAVRAIFRSPTARASFARLAARLAESGMVNGIQEGLQEVSTILGSLSVTDDPVAQQQIKEEAPGRVKGSFTAGVQGGLALAVPGAGASYVADNQEASRAEGRAAYLTEMGQSVAESKTFKRLPEQAKDFVRAVQERNGGVVETASLPASDVKTLFQENDIDLSSKPNIAKQVADLEAQGYPDGEITIPLADFIADVASLKGFDGKAKKARYGNTLTIEEAKVAEKEAQKFEKERKAKGEASPALRVFEDMVQKQVEAGASPDVARTTSAICAALAESRASRGLAKDAWEYHQKQTVEVKQGEMDPVAASTTRLAQLMDGFTPEQVKQVFPGFFMRSAEEIEKTAEGMQQEVQENRVSKEVMDLVRQEMNRERRRPEAGERVFPGSRVLTEEEQKIREKLVLEEVAKLDALLKEGKIEKEMQAAQDFDNTRFSPTAVALGKMTDANMNTSQAKLPDAGDTKVERKRLQQTNKKAQARGAIDFDATRKWFKILLTGQANLSTFLHESGHAFFEMLQRDAEDGHAESLMDVDVLRGWLKAEPNAALTVEQLEKFARGFEKYLMEGKAPSMELQATFARVKAWMVHVYKVLMNLNVELTPEVREVFDRLLATDEAIAEQRQRQQYVLIDQFMGDGKLRALHEKAIEAATLDLEQEAIRIFKRAVKEDRDSIREEVEAEVNAELARNVLAMLKGEARPDGKATPPEVAELLKAPLADGRGVLNLWSADMVPAPVLSKLRKLGLVRKPGPGNGVNVEDVALSLGYSNEIDLLFALAGVESAGKVVRRKVNEQLAEKYEGFDPSPGWLEERALKALHSDAMGLALRAELDATAKAAGLDIPARGVHEGAKQIAKQNVAEMTGLEMTPEKFRRAEVVAAKDFQKAVAAKKFDEAWAAKRRQLYNHEMAKQTAEAKELFEKIRDYLASFEDVGKRKKLGLAGMKYLEAIDDILAGVELKTKSAAKLVKRGLLAAYLEEMEANGEPVNVPPEVRAGVLLKNYRQLTLEQLTAVQDAVKNIAHLAQKKNRIRLRGKEMSLENTADKMAEHIGAQAGEKFTPDKKTLKTDAERRSWWRQAFANLKKIEFLARDLDGGAIAGYIHSLIFQPFRDAEREEVKLQESILLKAKELVGEFAAGDAFRLGRVVDFLGTKADMAKVLAIAMNLGNAGNRARLIEGQKQIGIEWTYEDIIARLDELLTDKDIARIQGIHDLMGVLAPAIKEQSERTTGVPFELVEAEPVVLPSGRKWAGGYYPIVKSKESRRGSKSQKQRDLNESNFMRPGTYDGFTKGRGNDMSPLNLDLRAVPDHLLDVIHYLTHSEVVREVDRLTRMPQVETAIKNAMGSDMYGEIEKWLVSLGSGTSGPRESTGYFNAFLRRMRYGGTIVMYGAKISSGIWQQLGHATTISELGLKYTWEGVKQALEASGDATKESIEIQQLARHFDRDLNDMLQSGLTKFGWLRQMNDKVAMFSMSWLLANQRFVSTVAWYGARSKALAEGHADPVAYADSVVAMTQAGGGLKDLADIQRGDELKKTLTVAYTYFSVLYNQLAWTMEKTKESDSQVAAKAAQLFWVVALPVVIEGWLRGRMPDEDDDESKLGWMAKETFLYMSRSFPGLGTLAEAALTDKDPRRAPWWDATLRGFSALGSIATKQEMSEGDVLALAKLAGTYARLPAGALMNAIKYGEGFDGMEDEWLNLFVRSPSEFK